MVSSGSGFILLLGESCPSVRERVFEMSGEPDALALELTGLQKSYRSPEGELTPIVDVASFTLKKSEQVAIAGRSGSGKTTFN